MLLLAAVGVMIDFTDSVFLALMVFRKRDCCRAGKCAKGLSASKTAS